MVDELLDSDAHIMPRRTGVCQQPRQRVAGDILHHCARAKGESEDEAAFPFSTAS
jgi:hypothetical protein